jgi:hypothetical protein
MNDQLVENRVLRTIRSVMQVVFTAVVKALSEASKPVHDNNMKGVEAMLTLHVACVALSAR